MGVSERLFAVWWDELLSVPGLITGSGNDGSMNDAIELNAARRYKREEKDERGRRRQRLYKKIKHWTHEERL